MHTFVYKSVDDCPIHLDVYPAETSGPAPVVMCIHGGALIFGARSGIASGGHALLRERFTERGYTQVSIDYRLAPETKLREIVGDVRDAWRWCHDELPHLFDVDTRRAGVLGRSAGGYLTLMAGSWTEPRPKALVAFYGYGSVTSSWYAEPSEFYRSSERLIPEEQARAVVGARAISEAPDTARTPFYIYCRQQGTWVQEVAGLNPATDTEELAAYDPIRKVSAAYPPTLLIHGTADTDVPHEESSTMASALESAGATVELASLDGLEHAFDTSLTAEDLATDTPSPAARSYDRVLRFLDTWL